MRVFGPIPSRRLGKSLEINNIPYKICTYSCIYCQIGKAVKMLDRRQEFYKPDELVKKVKTIPVDENKINEAYHIFTKKLAAVEYLTGYERNAFSSSGNLKEDILSITAVHPMREDAIEELLKGITRHLI